jgi:hypothetical protein
MTGMMVRVCRDGVWQNVEIDELTDLEFEVLDERLDHEWAVALAKWIRDHVKDGD